MGYGYAKMPLEDIRKELQADWDDIGPEYGVRGGETRLSLITRAILAMLDEMEVKGE